MIWTKWFFCLITFFCITGYSEENKKNRSQVSEDLAHVLWHIMKNYEGEYNFDQLCATLSNLNIGKLKNKSLDDCYASLIKSIEKKAIEKGELNLQTANSYLQKLGTTPDCQPCGIHEVVKNKLYYKVIKPGTGDPLSNLNSSPLISFKEKTLTGEILSDYTSGIRIPLSETISGLQKGIKGIKVGEKRELFIHPDLAYGEFPKPDPYSLIIIEVTFIAP